MQKDVYDDYIKAGKIASEAIELSKKIVKNDVLLIDIANEIESFIIKKGGNLAFPINLSLNNIAAHYTPFLDDKTVLNNDLIKVDIGVHVNGRIADTAITIDLSKENIELVKASEVALKNALNIIKPGVTLGEIGKVIEDSIKSHGFNPIRNLSGHGLSDYSAHTGNSIPNFNTMDNTQLVENEVIAIEPFATNGIGLIKEKGEPYIFSITRERNVRSNMSRKLLQLLKPYKNLPFAPRYFTNEMRIQEINFAIRELGNLNMIHAYPPLVENGLVSQSEHSVIVRNKPVIYTKNDD